MNSDTTSVVEQMRKAISLAKAGEPSKAEAIFDSVLARHPNLEQALVWKAAVSLNPDETVRCLEHALRLNPANERAQAGLAWAYKRQRLARQGTTTNEPFPNLNPSKSPSPANSSQSEARPSPTSLPPEKPTSLPQITNSNTSNTFQPSPRLSVNPASAVPKNKIAPTPTPTIATQKSANPPTVSKFKRKKEPKKESISSIFKTASAGIEFTIAPNFFDRKASQNSTQIALYWPLLSFGLALSLAVLSLFFTLLGPILGVLAISAALVGVILFNRATF